MLRPVVAIPEIALRKPINPIPNLALAWASASPANHSLNTFLPALVR